MDTHFASAERAGQAALAGQIQIVSNDPIVSGLLHTISGLLAVLNEHRQIIALNDSLLRLLGIEDPAKALGLRPGEALQCIHAEDEPAGCGTTEFCSSCGAAIAIVSSLGQDRPVEKICALSANRGGQEIDIALLVKSHPIIINNNRFLLLFLQDITLQQQRAALERTFFHDVNNMLSMLLGASELLISDNPSELAKAIHQAALRLHREIAIQRCLLQSETYTYQPIRHLITTQQVLADLETFFTNHPSGSGKHLEFQQDHAPILINTDISLLSRVLANMIINALEASQDNGSVKIWIEQNTDYVSFCVWNAQEIPPDIVGRIFQRNFSTKEQAGRGIGTFSMKLFGEKILGGQVDFSTSEQGTVFRFTLPL